MILCLVVVFSEVFPVLLFLSLVVVDNIGYVMCYGKLTVAFVSHISYPYSKSHMSSI